MNLKKYILAVSAACIVIAAGAQDLTKEIVIEKDYKPVEHKVSKLNDAPEMVKIATINNNRPINFSEWNVPLSAGNQFPVLLPYGYKTAPSFSTKRGYFNFGIGMYMNMLGSAGYRILDTDKTNLNVWLQHNSMWGGDFEMQTVSSASYNYKQKFINDILGVDFSHKFGDKTFNAKTNYHFARLDYIRNNSEYFNNINEFNLDLSLANSLDLEKVNYQVGLRYNHFGNGFEDAPTKQVGVKENHYNLNGVVSMPSGEESRVGLALNADYLYYTQGSMAIEDNKGKVRFTPYYSQTNDKLNLKLGVNFDVSFSNGTILRFSPEVKADYKFSNFFSLEANAKGGKQINTLADNFTRNRFISPLITIGSSYTPVDANLGFKFGPYSGFQAKVYAGYGITRSAQMPIAYDYSKVIDYSRSTSANGGYDNTFEYSYITALNAINMKGLYLGIDAAYSYEKFATLSIGGKYSKQDGETGYTFGLDRPEYVLNANLEVNPITNLKLNIGYELRGNRALWTPSLISGSIIGYAKTELANCNNLNFGASYQITDMIGVFAHLNNILNKKWEVVPMYNNQKFSAMGGISLQF